MDTWWLHSRCSRRTWFQVWRKEWQESRGRCKLGLLLQALFEVLSCDFCLHPWSQNCDPWPWPVSMEAEKVFFKNQAQWLSRVQFFPMNCLWTVALQALLSMGSPRQECWSGLPSAPPVPSPKLWVQWVCGATNTAGKAGQEKWFMSWDPNSGKHYRVL